MNRRDDSELIFEAYLDTQPVGLKETIPGFAKKVPPHLKSPPKPGADPKHIQKVIDFYTKGPPEERRMEDGWHRIAKPQFHDMASGGSGEGEEEYSDTRSMFYNKWKDEDFQTVIDAIESL